MPKHLVIGLGSIGKRHKLLLEEVGETVYGLDIGDTPNWDVDMVWICTPEKAKDDYVKEAMKRSKKIFVEKPYSMPAIYKNIWVACNMRFHPAVQCLKKHLDKVGGILYARLHFSHYLPYQRANWKEYIKDTNIILDAGWHYVDLALWLFGEAKNFNGFKQKEFDFPDIAQIILEHDNNLVTHIWLDYLRRDKSCGVEIIGTKGTLTWLSEGKNPELATVRFRKNQGAEKILFKTWVWPNESFRNQRDYLLKENWESNLDNAIEVLKICT